MSTLSFTGTRQVRYPAPDVARGFMLALIALANVPVWARFLPDHPAAGQAALSAMTDIDQWWFLVRAMFVDRRAYPLFSILFGFGMAIMARRTIERERRVALEALPAELSAGWIPLQWQFFHEAVERRARRAASRLIRRRGWWMLLFGGVHALIFQGDIIGAYGLTAVMFAEVIVMRRVWPRVAIGVSFAALSLLLLTAGASTMGGHPMTLEYHSAMTLEPTTPLWSFAGWLVSTPFTVFTALVVPCVMMGVGLERWGALQDPRAYRGVLLAIALGGLAIGAMGAVPHAMSQLDWALSGSAAWSFPLYHATGVAGACGWLALLAVLGGGPREVGEDSDEELGAVRSFLSAIGRRSMTAYLAQTVVFALVFAAIGAAGVRVLGVAVCGLIALGVWALIGVGCVISDAVGATRGPAERLLRWLVARSAFALALPALPPAIYAGPVPTGPTGPTGPTNPAMSTGSATLRAEGASSPHSGDGATGANS